MAARNAFVLGASGEVGKELVRELEQSNFFNSILIVTRRNVDADFDKNLVQQKIVDFDKIEEHADIFKNVEYGFCCLGTTRAKSGAKGFYKVDHDYVVNAAKVAKENGCQHFSLVSSAGANKNSFFLYPQTKGKTEEDLEALNFEKLSIYRPGLLLCDRKEWNLPERVAKIALKPVIFMFPTMLSVPTTHVAKAMVKNVIKPEGNSKVSIFYNGDIHRMAAD